MSVSILLPVPPSTNALTKNIKVPSQSRITPKRLVTKRAKTDQYKAWIKEAGFDLNTQHPPRTEGKVSITLNVPATRHRDADNYAKAILDLLVSHTRIDDDRDVFELRIIKDMDARDKRVKVTIKPYEV